MLCASQLHHESPPPPPPHPPPPPPPPPPLSSGRPGLLDQEVQGERGGGRGCGEAAQQGHQETRGEAYVVTDISHASNYNYEWNYSNVLIS